MTEEKLEVASIQVEVTPELLAEWYKAQKDLAFLKAREAQLRSIIFKNKFPNPVEGTNTVALDDGTSAVIKATHVINRNVDIGSLDALRAAQQQEGYNGPKVNLDEVIRWKPELSVTAYKALTAEEQMFVDQALIVKPGSPQLEITIPKRAKV
jgi:hypothetical protein